MNALPLAKVEQITKLVVEGRSQRYIARAVGASKVTVARHQSILETFFPEEMATSEGNVITLPIINEAIKRPRYIGGGWFDTHRRWSASDKDLLTRLCAAKVDPNMAASTLGRAPSALARYARENMGLRIPEAWLALTRNVRERVHKLSGLNYPYLVQSIDKYADLIAVNKLVPAGMEGREDVCQDVLLALWESRLTLDDLRREPHRVRDFIRSFRKASFERGGYGVESMDELLADGVSKYDHHRFQRELVRNDESMVEEYILNGAAHRVEENFADAVIRSLSDEEESLGIPAALWRNFGLAL